LKLNWPKRPLSGKIPPGNMIHLYLRISNMDFIVVGMSKKGRNISDVFDF
jgi:hypothetical protein